MEDGGRAGEGRAGRRRRETRGGREYHRCVVETLLPSLGRQLIHGAVRKGSVASNGPATPKTPSGPSPNTRTLKTDGVTGGFTGDKTRDKCIELVYDALASDSGARASSLLSPAQCTQIGVPFLAVDLILQKAKAIETAVYAEIGGITQPYPTKMRSLFVNLKDKNNPSLREAVASGDIPVEKFVTMSSQASRLYAIVCHFILILI